MPRAQQTLAQAPQTSPTAGEIFASGRLSVIDAVALELLDFGSNGGRQVAPEKRCALLWWMSTMLGYGAGFGALCLGVHALYFPDKIARQKLACDTVIDADSRRAIHWFVGTAPAWARNSVALAMALWGCRKAGGLQGPNAGLVTGLLAGGVGEADGDAEAAGWRSIVGGHSDGRPQSKWADARDARGLTEWSARWLAGLKLGGWHWSQPLAYLWLLWSYRCYVAELGPQQQYLAALVAARELIYMVTTLIALRFCPVFLLLDLRTAWNEANGLERATHMAMYMLTPHTYTALCLANRFRRWVRAFLVLAAVQVLADLSSCYALAHLMASSIEVAADNAENSTLSFASGTGCVLQPGRGSDADLAQVCAGLDTEARCQKLDTVCVWTGEKSMNTGPLEVGYGFTAFGFLLFFGPLSIASSLRGAMNNQRHCLLRLAKASLGTVLLVLWVGIMVLLAWLMFAGGNPFCSGIPPFATAPCSGHGLGAHGGCYGAAQCNCAPEWGPNTRLSGTDLCSCKAGFIDGDAHCDHPTGCDEDPCGEHGDHCSAVGASYICTCQSGWSGQQCEQGSGCDDDPCGSHGDTCTATGSSHSCTCKSGWCSIDDCKVGGIGDNNACAFIISGATDDAINGEYTKTIHKCSNEPVYQKGGSYALFKPNGGVDWMVGSVESGMACENYGNLESGGQGSLDSCAVSPDGPGCAGKWEEIVGCPGGQSWCTNAAIKVVAKPAP